MQIALSSTSNPAPSLDNLIEYTRSSVKRQAATVQRLKTEGYDASDATKRLTEMIATLAALKRRKRVAV